MYDTEKRIELVKKRIHVLVSFFHSSNLFFASDQYFY